MAAPLPHALPPLSVLDLFPVSASSTPSRVIRESAELIRIVEALGYTRYWVAEHHGMPSIATSAPEVLIAHLAGASTKIRVGAGGIMLPNHTPLRVVEIFRTLEALYPGRIDLGLGRAPGTDPTTAAALRSGGPGSDDPDERLAELLAFERHEFPDGHPFRAILPMPSDVSLPPIWMLGSTLAGATIAATLGVRYAFAGHFAMRYARPALARYRELFRPSAWYPDFTAPYAMLAVTVVCGEDDEHARRLAAPLKLAIVNTRTGRPQPIASVEDALAYRFTPEEQAIADDFFNGAIIGGPDTVRAGLLNLAADLNPDELMISALLPDLRDRIQSYQRIADIAASVRAAV